MLTQTNLKDVAHVFTEMWDKGDVALADELFAPDFIDHDPVEGQGPGVEGYKQMLTAFRTAFPDLKVESEDVIVENNKVVVRWTAKGTHNGPLMQIPSTGKVVTLKGIDILHIENEKIIERWGEFDAAGMLGQLGVLPG